MKKLLLSIMLLGTALSSTAEESKEPFAPKGSNWKYWFADANTTGYILNIVISDTTVKVGYVDGSDELISVKCSKIASSRGVWSHAAETSFEANTDFSQTEEEAFRYMFKEGNKAYVYDMFDSTFYKMIDMDAQPGDTWRMSLFSGKFEDEYAYTKFTHDAEQGVPAELISFFTNNTDNRFITDENWACYLDFEPFYQDLRENGIDSMTIEQWKTDYADCVTTAPALEGDTSVYYIKATQALNAKDYPYTTETWACDFAYYHYHVKKFAWDEIDRQDRDAILALCDASLNVLKTPASMPKEIVDLWKKLNRYDKNTPPNYDYTLITKHNWPGRIGRIQNDLMLPEEQGGLGLTQEEVQEKYSKYAEFVYEQTPHPGEVDLVEVVEKRSIEVNGESIPIITMGPACSSELDPRAIRSKVALRGAYNIHYFNMTQVPWPEIIDDIHTAYEIHYHGLLCAQNGAHSINTPEMYEYMENGQVDLSPAEQTCDNLRAPNFEHNKQEASRTARASLLAPKIKKTVRNEPGTFNTITTESPDSALLVNTVVHVIHNEDNPAGKVSEAQINDMIDAINNAFMAKNDMKDLHQADENIVGTPGIKLRLATKNPEGEASNGILYYTTTLDSFALVGEENKVRYAYKYDNDGNPRNWDHRKYLNIYIADFGAKDSTDASVGGFVTIPEKVTDPANYDKWLESNDTEFWSKWIESETSDAKELDGLSLDYHATFNESASAEWKYKTAIHELGHYFGLKHIASILVSKRTGQLPSGQPIYTDVLYGDNFDDTPEQPYTVRIYDDCSRELFLCGERAQINNFMGYSLPCANMFTKQQAAYMRMFTETVRPGIFEKKEETSVKDIEAIAFTLSPNPAEDDFEVILKNKEPFDLRVFDLSGKLVQSVHNAFGQTRVSLEHLAPGMYVVEIQTTTNTVIKKVIKK